MSDLASSASSQQENSASNRGLNIQLDAAANDLRTSLRENKASPRSSSSEWDAIENKASILKDLSKLQKELEMIARSENRKIYQSYPLPPRPPSSNSSPTVPSSSPVPSSRTSMHFRRYSLISDEEFTVYEDDMTLFDSDIDCNANISTDLDPSEATRKRRRTSNGSSRTAKLEDPVEIPHTSSELEPNNDPRFSQGLMQIRQGLHTIISAGFTVLQSNRSLIMIVVLSGLVFIAAQIMGN